MRTRPLTLTTSALLGAIALSSCSSPLIVSKQDHHTSPSSITQGLRYSLPKAYLNVKVNFKPSGPTTPELYEFTITPAALPDTSNSFVLDYDPSIFSTENVTITTSPAGLLSKVELKADDQTDAIILKLLETAKEGLKAAAVASIGEPIGEFTVPADDPSELDRMAKHVTNGKATLSISPAAPRENAPACRGVIAPIPEPRTIQASATGKNVSATPSATVLVVPSSSQFVCIEYARASMVEKITNLSFDNGLVTQIHLEKPSEALAFVEIPLTAARMLASLPAELIQLKVDYSSKEKALFDARKAELEAQQSLVKAIAKINDPSAGDEPTPDR